jgi:PadR family transcriptional regulator PadR
LAAVDPKTSRRRLVLLVLGVLRNGPFTGDAIARRITEPSVGVFQPGEGLLYPLLHELEEEGSIASRWEEADERRRKVYTLTAHGHQRYTDELARFKAETGATMAVLAGTEGHSPALG